MTFLSRRKKREYEHEIFKAWQGEGKIFERIERGGGPHARKGRLASDHVLSRENDKKKKERADASRRDSADGVAESKPSGEKKMLRFGGKKGESHKGKKKNI